MDLISLEGSDVKVNGIAEYLGSFRRSDNIKLGRGGVGEIDARGVGDGRLGGGVR